MKEYIADYFLTAGECTPEGTIPVTLLANRIIETATFHANILGVGYENLITNGMAWVLSRMSIEMRNWPKVNRKYSLRTWVESYNRHFSERNFEITDENGGLLGYARTVWMTINLTTRQSGQLDGMEKKAESVVRPAVGRHRQIRRIHLPLHRLRLQPPRQHRALHGVAS